MESLDNLREMVSNAGRLVAFTGAGISAESGIPTYRGDGGVWRKYDPAKYADINYFLKEPAYYWNFFKEVRSPGLRKARPNEAHEVLAGLEKKGKLQAIITQNIDGLHQLAGSKRVLELHGNTRRFSCLDCRERFSIEVVDKLLETQLPPQCPDCRGGLRPEVVFFGEPLSPAVLNEAIEEAQRCDLFLAIGSSLVVQPAASLPVRAKEHGARLIIINKEPAPLDAAADLCFHSSASEVLTGIV